MLFMSQNNVVSSAYMIILNKLVLTGKSLMYIEKEMIPEPTPEGHQF